MLDGWVPANLITLVLHLMRKFNSFFLISRFQRIEFLFSTLNLNIFFPLYSLQGTVSTKGDFNLVVMY